MDVQPPQRKKVTSLQRQESAVSSLEAEVMDAKVSGLNSCTVLTAF